MLFASRSGQLLPPGDHLFAVPAGTANSPCRLAGYKVAPLPVEGGVVLLEHGGHAAPEPVHLQGSAGMARRTLCDAALDT